MPNQAQTDLIRAGQGFIAALDQSGGSTPKALRQYGITEDAYNGEDQMFDLIHDMRSRIVTSPAFTGDKVVGAILFEMTMERDIEGTPSAQYLWEECGVVPFLKVDKGLEDTAKGVQLMKPMPQLDAVLDRAVEKGIYGTKMRSVVHEANVEGIKDIVDQQFAVGQQIIAKDLMPILEPEVNITAPDKIEAENMLLEALLDGLDALPDDQMVMLKLTLPEQANLYQPVINHPQVLQVVALSGGYSREEANARLSQNTGMIASFSRGLTEGLSAQQDATAFDAMLGEAVSSIYEASIAG